jgi:predicted transcriptional regulator
MRKFLLSEIVELYVDRQMTMKQVADHLGVTPQAVSYRLKSADISARERSVRKPRNYEKALLEKLYVSDRSP